MNYTVHQKKKIYIYIYIYMSYSLVFINIKTLKSSA